MDLGPRSYEDLAMKIFVHTNEYWPMKFLSLKKFLKCEHSLINKIGIIVEKKQGG